MSVLPPPLTTTSSLAGPTAPHAVPGSLKTRQPAWEFTKRKKWPELLIAELADTLVLVLSPARTIWYCGPAITDILGWSDHELLDQSIDTYISETDIQHFRARFSSAFSSTSDLSIFTHLKCRPDPVVHPALLNRDPHHPHLLAHFPSPHADINGPARELLCELRGHRLSVPSFIDSSGIPGQTNDGSAGEASHAGQPLQPALDCMIIMAKPYPSPNTSMLTDFLRLKTENESLNQRLVDLRTTLHPSAHSAVERHPMYGPFGPVLATSPLSSSPSTTQAAYRHRNHASMEYASGGSVAPMPPTGYSSSVLRDSLASAGVGVGSQDTAIASSSNSGPDLDEGSSRRKKAKKSSALGDYVCAKCGRTDSPEWRKGPLGPKTLCNACGLRWAKTAREKSGESPLDNGTHSDAIAAGMSTADLGAGPPPLSSMGRSSAPSMSNTVAQQVQAQIPAASYGHLMDGFPTYGHFPGQNRQDGHIHPTPVARVMDVQLGHSGLHRLQ